MTKHELIHRISQQTGLDAATSRLIIETFFEVVKSALIDGKPIHVRGFGSFLVKARAAKMARNISQNTAVLVAARAIPSFKPSADFTNQLQNRASYSASKQQKRMG